MKAIRPTTALVFQALFNILGDLKGRAFLDLFSGTGKIALEACKRGARPVLSVELVKARSKDIWEKNPFDFHTHLCMDVRKALSWICRRGISFDAIFADPPYGAGWPEELPEILSQRPSLMKSGGLLIIEHAKNEPVLPAEPWVVKDERVYGKSALSFLSWNLDSSNFIFAKDDDP